MSKLKSDKINFDDDDFLVEINTEQKKADDVFQQDFQIEEKNKVEALLETTKEEAQNIILNAQQKANEIIEGAKKEALEEKNRIIEEAEKNAQEIVQKAKEDSEKETQSLMENSKDEIEKSKTDAAIKGYEEGHKDGLEKIQEELEEKIRKLDDFCSLQYEIKEKIIKSAKNDILSVISNIAKKILLKEVDGKVLEKITDETISLLNKKENINIVLSEKYANLLYELQKKSLDNDLELKIEDFKQYKNFNLVFNSKFDDDTLIVENLEERYDSSINSQLDIIIRNIYEASQQEGLSTEEYETE